MVKLFEIFAIAVTVILALMFAGNTVLLGITIVKWIAKRRRQSYADKVIANAFRSAEVQGNNTEKPKQ